MDVGNHFAQCAALVRAADYDRYLSVLFAPKEARAALFALYAFNYEVAKTAESVSEPTLGLIRLQWWRDAIAEIFEGKPRGHEVVQALFETITRLNLPRVLFDALIDAREEDLSPAPFATLPELAFYADRTSGHVMRLATRILGVGSALDAHARELGIAYALTGLLRALPFHTASERLMLPVEMVQAAGLRPGHISSGKPENIRTLMENVAGVAERHLAAAPKGRIARGHLPALLPAALVRPYLKRMTRSGFDPFREPAEISVPRRQIAMLASVLKGRV